MLSHSGPTSLMPLIWAGGASKAVRGGTTCWETVAIDSPKDLA